MPGSKPRLAIDRARQQGSILLSFDTLTELSEVLSRKQFRRYLDEEDMRRFLAALTQEAHWVEVDAQISACRDPKDDKFLALAVRGHATHIITGDADLLALGNDAGIPIINAAEAITRIS